MRFIFADVYIDSFMIVLRWSYGLIMMPYGFLWKWDAPTISMASWVPTTPVHGELLG